MRVEWFLVCAAMVAGCGTATQTSEVPLVPSPAAHAAAPTPSPAESTALRSSPLPLPAGATSALRLTTGPGGVTLSWIAEGESRGLRAARWTEQGWEPAMNVTQRPTLMASWADAPTVVAGSSHIAAAWIEEAGEGHAMHLWVATARNGAAFSEPIRVHEDTSATEHGFVSLFPNDDGSTEVVWLDGRGYAGEAKETALMRRTLRADGTLGDEGVVDSRTCDCCPTAGTLLASGAPLVVWRDRIGGEVRDLSAVRLTEGGAPSRVHADGWEFAGCPVNGPGLAALGRGAVVSWYTEAGGPRVKVARTDDGDSWTGVEDIASGDDVLGKTSVLPLGDYALVTWVEKAESAGKLMGRTVTADALGAPMELGMTDAGRSAGFPSMASVGDQVLIVSAGEGLLVSTPRL